MKSWWELGEWSGHTGTELALYLIECPFCGEKGNFAVDHHAENKKPNSDKKLNLDTLKCGNCAKHLMVLWSAGEYSFRNGIHDYRMLPWPLSAKKAPDYLPTAIGRSWAQVQKSLGSESWDAAAVMARTALETAIQDKGGKGKVLFDMIEDLATKGILPPLMKEWAHEVRLLGKRGTHKSGLDQGTEQRDARDIAEFLDYVLHYLYSLPKDIKEYRKRNNKHE